MNVYTLYADLPHSCSQTHKHTQAYTMVHSTPLPILGDAGRYTYKSVLERDPPDANITTVELVFSQKLPTFVLRPFAVVSECDIPGHLAPLTTLFPVL